MTTIDLNKTLDELKFEFSDMTGFLQDAFSREEKSLTSIKNNVNQTNKRRRLAKFQNITGPNGIDGMTTKFSEAQNVLMKKTASEITMDPAAPPSKLEVYDNTLPFGLPPVIAGVNEELREVKEKTWDNFSSYYGKIFSKIGNDDFDAMIKNPLIGQSGAKNIIDGTCGSLSEWPQINPKSAGMGRCSTLFELFNKHYMGYSEGTGIKVSDFYHDLISSLHTAEIYGWSGKNKPTTITGFTDKIETYNINTDLWFLSDKDKEEAKYNGFARIGEDSYGKFFEIGGFPVVSTEYANVITHMTAHAGKIQYPSNDYDTFIRATDGLVNQLNGAFMRTSDNTNETIIFNNRNLVIMDNVEIDDGDAKHPTNKSLNKIYCSLFLNQGNETNINKLEEMDYMNYLLNIRKNGTFPAICKFPNETIQVPERHGDILITQRDPEIGLILLLRYAFELEYPIEVPDSRQPPGPGNQVINIFDSTANMIANNGGGGEGLTTTYGGTIYSQPLNEVKRKLIERITRLMAKFNGTSYYTEYIQKLLIQYINDIEAGTGVSYGAFPGIQVGINVCDLYFTPFIAAYNAGGIINTFSQNQHNLTFGNANIVNRFQNNNLAAPYDSVPVKVYRHLIYRLITNLYNKLWYLQAVQLDNNKYNLYDDNNNHAQVLTKSKSTATFNDLSDFKQLIPDVNPVMKGGKSKGINKIKTGGNKTKISSKKIQKGGARDTLFVDAGGAPNEGAPRLYANRKLKEFDPTLFKNAVKKYKELNFNSDYATVKSLFDKISHINSLPLFFDSYDNTRTRTIPTTGSCGGCGVALPAAGNTTLSFSEVAQLFLFNCVNTTTTTLLIHFFKNVKACLTHFVSTDLKTAEKNIGKNIGTPQTAKIEGSFRELNKELDKLINFLKYNTLNLQEQTINLNNNGAGANPNFAYNENEHYIKNLFLGANVYFSYAATANQFVVMRLTDNDDPAGGGGGVNWQGTNFFKLLNRIVGCTESSDDFTKTIQFLTDNRNDPAEYGLQTYFNTLTTINPLVNNRYLLKIRPHIKDKPDGCFGGIPFVSLDPKIYKLLMLSYYFLLKLRLVVGEESKKDQIIAEEEIFSELSLDNKREIIDTIKSKLTASAFSGLASSLTSNATLKQADLLFESFYLFLFNESNRLIEEVKKAEQLTKESSKNKAKKENLFTIKGGQSTSIYSLRPKTNSNNGSNLLKKQIDFIKTKYQASSKFDFIIETLTKQLKKQIELKKVKNNLHFFYYMDTHFRNFKIYMETVLLTIGEKNIPPEVSQKLHQYVKYSPDKSKYKESFASLKNTPLIDPQYSDPLWWANIERKFMSIQKQGNISDDVVYRLFIITTTPTSGLKRLTLRDMYIVDAFNLASMNDDRSKIDQPSWFSTGYRTHAGIKSVEISQKNNQGNNKFVYSDSNTVIKLTGIQFHDSKNNLIRRNNVQKLLPKNPTQNDMNKAIKKAIHPDIRKLINGEYLYYDKNDNRYKKLIPLFLQGSTNLELFQIVNHQRNIKYRGIKQKFSDTLDYTIYQMEDEKIQKLKEFRKWLYLIFMEQQMSLVKKDDDSFKTNIQKTMKQAFNNFLSSNITGKCNRVYNIYDYINSKTPTVQQIIPVRIKCSDFDNFDLGSVIIEGFISRESLIKLMLLY